MIYAKAFFELQLALAHKVTTLSALPLSQALLEYTNLYRRFGIGRAVDAAHPTWQQYVAGLRDANDVGEWTYRFYLARGGEPPGPPVVVATFGCFSYGRLDDGRIRLHFTNAEASGDSPLARQCAGRRRAELTALFEHMKRRADPASRVVGASWLYNLEAYRRLFPPVYLATARVLSGRFRHMPLWGQLLDRHGAVKGDLARLFLDRLERVSAIDTLDACFPLAVLSPEAPVQDFCEFYGVSSPVDRENTVPLTPAAARRGPAAARP